MKAILSKSFLKIRQESDDHLRVLVFVKRGFVSFPGRKVIVLMKEHGR